MFVFNTFIEKYKNLDNKTKQLLHTGFIFCLLLCIFSAFVLFIYQSFYQMPILFYVGLSLFKSSIMFVCTFIMCAIGFDTIRNEIRQ